MTYKCDVCSFDYDDESESTKLSDLPDDWICPLCGASKDSFSVIK